ncbi:hypothetical protein NDU88_000012 [Pleurodeles waltl]|uniref:Uncharacterized protein n=1 Tax=Pleurodeles waltl TaxID=8319 RepID=A0AAV7UNS2_PLEWA|nr:hypothetical protein NDU88_000012 [Pleurodeles waltl]
MSLALLRRQGAPRFRSPGRHTFTGAGRGGSTFRPPLPTCRGPSRSPRCLRQSRQRAQASPADGSGAAVPPAQSPPPLTGSLLARLRGESAFAGAVGWQ